MHNLRLVRLVLSFILLFTSPITAYSSSPVPLWGDAVSGMSLKQVLSVVENSRPVSDQQELTLKALAVIDNFEFAGRKFNVSFFFNDKNQLQFVRLKLNENGSDMDMGEHRVEISKVLLKRLGSSDMQNAVDSKMVASAWYRGPISLVVVQTKSTDQQPAAVFMIIKKNGTT